ncbi:MAG: universal stress protein [Chloroflexi bacterium]|nr:universal stress protein [Chloroflexota bacterium]
MTGPARVLIVANRTAATDKLLEAVRRRAQAGPATFHLLVPATPRGLHRVVDPEDAGHEEAAAQLELALKLLRQTLDAEVTGNVGVADPMGAIADTLHEREIDEIIISTLPRRLSKWMHLDLPSKVRGLGKPVMHIQGERPPAEVAEAIRVA